MKETRMLFAGKPEDKVTAAVQRMREALIPCDGGHGVVTDATA
jgi:hypothetical protein